MAYGVVLSESAVVYKVVVVATEEDSNIEVGEMMSAISRRKAAVHYEIGKKCEAPEWLAEKGHHILAFDSVSRAVRFADRNISSLRETRILECGGWEIVDPPKTFDMIDADWGILRYAQIQYPLPDGTVCCKAITPRRILFRKAPAWAKGFPTLQNQRWEWYRS